MGANPTRLLLTAGELPWMLAQTGIELSLPSVLKVTSLCAGEMGLKPLDPAECQIL